MARFAAAQAAQKSYGEFIDDVVKFAAAQAAQKKRWKEHYGDLGFAAAQAAQKIAGQRYLTTTLAPITAWVVRALQTLRIRGRI